MSGTVTHWHWQARAPLPLAGPGPGPAGPDESTTPLTSDVL